MSRVEELNQYIQELFDYWDGKNDDFEPIAGMQEQSGGRDEFGRKKKTIFIHAYMILEMEEQDR